MILSSWCVVGLVNNQTKAGKFGCNRIMFKSADTVKAGSHYFTVPIRVKDSSIGNMLMTGDFWSLWKKKLARLMDTVSFLFH